MSTTLSAAARASRARGAGCELHSGLCYFYNGIVHTMNPAAPVSPHLLVQGNRVWHCSNDAAPLGLDFRDSAFAVTKRNMSRDVQFIDLGGRTVIPGLVDAHVHFLWWALNLKLADLSTARSEDQAVQMLKGHCSNAKPGEWIVGFGWSHNAWKAPGLPSSRSLDEAFAANPVYLSSKCGHLAWVNSAALAAAEVTASTGDPAGGEIERAEGRITGILKETANALVHDRIAAPTDEQRMNALRQGQEIAHSLGITGMHTPEDLDTWGFMQRAHENKELTMRVNFWIPASALESLESLQIRHGLGDDRLRIGAVKLFSDGSLGGRTALMQAPYENEPENFGICVCEADEIERITLKANRAGLAMAIHAIGDKAVDNVLRAYESAQDQLRSEGGAPPIQNRIEHLQVLSPEFVPRLQKVRPIASMQPVHLCADMGPADRFWGARGRYAYAFRTLQEAGCTLAFGSDAPVEPVNPFYGLYAATTRRSLENEPAGGWYPEEKISLQCALEAYTINTAVASGQAAQLGSLAPGKLADFVVVEQDPFEVSPAELRDIKPVATYSGGRLVWGGEFMDGG
ncbi:MAG: amidohydrolase [Candidatus Sumerlaeaceae bacterium]